MEKTSRKLVNGQNIYDSKNKIDTRCSPVPVLGLCTSLVYDHNSQTMFIGKYPKSQVSVYHWSSGVTSILLIFYFMLTGYAKNVYKTSDEVIMAYCAEHLSSYPRKYEPHHEKPGFLPVRNKGADHLSSNCSADQRLCFRDMDSTILLLLLIPQISSF